ncbi:MAG: succinate dehydrogenase cytochrome b subunit [Caldilineae bacterium]|nr:succinate dehydrogenase cytochrome b subunit [Chloroflexota bacterium]MCB9175529.1 succinate dehydrogenase cytochrome b subunit [Caldilineae bacterium]
MLDLRAAAWSSVGKKLITGLTGLGLVVFVTVHLIGNLTIFMGAEAFNAYSDFLASLLHGWFIVLADLGLVGFFGLHAWSGLSVWQSKRRARSSGYAVSADARGPSRKTASSRSMLYSGIFLGIYVVLHVWHLKFGAEYVTTLHGEEVRDLYRLVVEQFNRPAIALAYALSMLFLGLHLRHGVWSMLQSLGMLNRRLLPTAYGAALILGGLLAIGFLVLPLYVLFFVDPVGTAAAMGGLR